MSTETRSLEVCREFLSDRCKRSESDCRYAHPQDHVEVINGRVTCCVDSLRDKCKRDNPPCRYFHPPSHLKEKLLSIGRSSSRGGGYENGGSRGGRGDYGGSPPSYGRSNSYGGGSYGGSHGGGGGGGGSFRGNSFGGGPYGDGMDMYGDYGGLNPYLANTLRGCKALLDAAVGARSQQRSYGGGGGYGPSDMMDSPPPRQSNSNSTVEVCREFLRGKCSRGTSDCRYAHPESRISVNSDNTVTVCMDYIRGKCNRDSCRYFHAPTHLQEKLRRGGGSSSFSSSRKRPYDYDDDADRSWKRK